MNPTLVKAAAVLAPTCMLLVGSAIVFSRNKSILTFLQLVGAGALITVVLAHICEALHLFPWMKWGRENSVGHYLDLLAAVLGLTLFPIGFLLNALVRDSSTTI
jgi:amino acid permease